MTMNNEELDQQLDTEAPSEDISQEEAQLESPEKNADSLEQQLEDAQKKSSENWEMFLRSKAEIDNLRRRNQIDLEKAHKYGVEKLVNELIPVIDSMDLGLAAQDASAESMREGMELTMNMLKTMMDKLGIEVVDPMNEAFNPDKHQAMTMQPSAEVEPNTVIAVMQKGYLLNERLLRPAMVMVSKAPE